MIYHIMLFVKMSSGVLFQPARQYPGMNFSGNRSLGDPVCKLVYMFGVIRPIQRLGFLQTGLMKYFIQIKIKSVKTIHIDALYVIKRKRHNY